MIYEKFVAPMLNTTFSNGSEATNSASLMSILENLIPGLSLLTSPFPLEYLNVNVSPYLGIILVIILSSGATFYTDGPLRLFKSYFTSTTEIRYNDELYNYVMYWITKHGLSKELAHSVAGTRMNSISVYLRMRSKKSEDEEDLFDYEDITFNGVSKTYRNWDKMKAIHYTPASGTRYFRYRGHWMAFTRSEENRLPGEQSREKLLLSCLGRKPHVIKELIQEAQIAYLERESNRTAVYRSTRPHRSTSDDVQWEKCISRHPRPLSTVVLDAAQKQLVVDDMEEYLHPMTRRWYSNRGIPYRRGYLFHGPPGTGKTSLCVAIAGVLRLSIYVANLNSENMTEDSLASLFRDLPRRCIVLLEDVDSAGIAVKREISVEAKKPREQDAEDRDNPRITKGISLSGLLNIIDGVASSEGRILIMTTNHMERLDPALLRPGRVDLNIRFGYADEWVAKGLFLAIYSTIEADISAKKNELGDSYQGEDNAVAKDSVGGLRRYAHGKTEEELKVMAEQFGAVVSSRKLTPAEIQGYLLKHKARPEDAVKELEVWIEREDTHEA
jgi:chaperone BCS1